jgi:hypothetical protein
MKTIIVIMALAAVTGTTTIIVHTDAREVPLNYTESCESNPLCDSASTETTSAATDVVEEYDHYIMSCESDPLCEHLEFDPQIIIGKIHDSYSVQSE